MNPEFTTALVRGLGHAGIVGAISFFTLWADPNISTRTLVSGAMLPALTVLGTRWFGEGFLDTRKAGNGGPKMTCLAWLMFGALFLSGCAASNAAQFMEAAAKYRDAQGNDTRSWCVKNDLSTIYGTDKMRLAVTGQANVSVSCTDEGLTVKSNTGTGSVELPMTIRPSFTIAPK